MIWPHFGCSETPINDPDLDSRFDAGALRQDAIERVAVHLGTDLVKTGPANFSSKDGDTRVVCLASQPYELAHGKSYWYGFTPAHKEFLEEAKVGFIALACG